MRVQKSISSLVLALTLVPFFATANSSAVAKKVTVYPWRFTNGTGTARITATSTVQEILEKKGLDFVKGSGASRSKPSNAALGQFAKRAGAQYAISGSTSWHTRSIWVGAGPKTISTATVNLVIVNTSGKVVFSRSGVRGRSDEKENTLKVIGAVLVTPLITGVSGGPKTPREQRAVQIALARALQSWSK
ncbi:MAG: hypothetical protein K8R88_08185 [Armatimonadetes bacterium]|nr:hypothetical protein [Armatimonadota bacterium]